jgi:zinc transporter ZupT
MRTIYTAVILLSLLSCLTTFLGVVLALLLRENRYAIAAGMGFSVGIMVLISTVELIPEAIAAMGAGATLPASHSAPRCCGWRTLSYRTPTCFLKRD